MRIIRLLAAVLAVALIFGACSLKKDSNPDGGADNKDPRIIVTSFYPMYVFTLNITQGVENVKVVNMTQPSTGCLHDYQLTPGDMKLLEKADVLVINGAGLENFIEDVRPRLGDTKIIDASEGLELLENGEELEPGEREDHGHSVNPHIWVSVSGAIGQVTNIGNELAEIDPANAEKYLSNARAFVNKLEQLRDKMHRELEDLRSRDIVTFHEAFEYFAEEFDLNVVAAVRQEPDNEPGPQQLARIIEIIRDKGVKAVFTEPQYPSKIAETIARETGVEIYELDPVATGPEKPGPDYYVRVMESNIEVLKKALE